IQSKKPLGLLFWCGAKQNPGPAESYSWDAWGGCAGEGRGMAEEPRDWAAWLDRHGAALVLLARQRVGSRADAEDVVQEAFVRFWRSRQRANDPVAFLYTCVRRYALDWQRNRGRRSLREKAAARPEA